MRIPKFRCRIRSTEKNEDNEEVQLNLNLCSLRCFLLDLATGGRSAFGLSGYVAHSSSRHCGTDILVARAFHPRKPLLRGAAGHFNRLLDPGAWGVASPLRLNVDFVVNTAFVVKTLQVRQQGRLRELHRLWCWPQRSSHGRDQLGYRPCTLTRGPAPKSTQPCFMSQPSSSCLFLRKPRGEVLKKNKKSRRNKELTLLSRQARHGTSPCRRGDRTLGARTEPALSVVEWASSRRFWEMQLRLKAMRGRIALRKRSAQNQVERVVPRHAVVIQRRLNALANVTAALPPDICAFGDPHLPSVRAGLAFFGEADPHKRLGGTCYPQRVGCLMRLCRPDIYTFGDPICHRSELDWHFQEKSTHLWAARSLTPATPDHPLVER
jgi:hypothetical protein